MSRTFASRPGVSKQTSRGRGRGQSSVTRPLPINQPSVKGSTGVSQPSVRGVSTRRGTVQTNGQPSVRGSMLPAGGFGAGGARSRGYGDSRGRGMDPYRDPYDDQQYGQEMGAEGMPENTQQGQSLQQRATHTGAYTVISPNEKKRRQITEQAERGMRKYEEHKQQNTPTTVSYVGTVGGGEVLSMAEARQQQIKAQPTKTTRLIREQERRETQKQREERELEEKKNEARRKAELNEHKQKERQDSWKTDMQRVNHAFLDRLEAQGKAAAADHHSSTQPPSRPQPSVSTRPKPTSTYTPHTSSPSEGGYGGMGGGAGRDGGFGGGGGGTGGGWRDGGAGGGREGGGGGASYRGGNPKIKPPQHTSGSQSLSQAVSFHQSSSELPSENLDRLSSDEDLSGGDMDSETEHDAQFYQNLEFLQGMFPNYPQETLSSILEQANGHVDDALQFLGV